MDNIKIAIWCSGRWSRFPIDCNEQFYLGCCHVLYVSSENSESMINDFVSDFVKEECLEICEHQ